MLKISKMLEININSAEGGGVEKSNTPKKRILACLTYVVRRV